MRIVVRGRQGGKTSEAIKWFLEHPGKRAIVCESGSEADRVAREIEKAWSFEYRNPASPQHTGWRYWLQAGHVITFHAFLDGMPHHREYCIDNLDLFLVSLGCTMATLTTLTTSDDFEVPCRCYP